MKKIILIISLIPFLSFAQGSDQYSTDQQNQSIFTKKQKIASDGVEVYDSNLEMKSMKRFGIGLVVGGATGLLGLNFEINVEPNDAAVFGLGTGSGYNSFGLGWKHNFIGNYLSPYTKVGYSKWFNSASGSNSAADSDVLRRILTDDEIKNNRFGADFLVGSAGLEYNQLEGDLSGINLFGEIVMMAEIKKTVFIPSGAIGINYYY